MAKIDKKTLKQIEYHLAAKNYVDYVQLVHDGLWLKSRFGRFLCDEIQAFVEADTGHSYDILIVNVPPQTGKSMTLTSTLPSWYLGKNPFGKVIELSYNTDYARQFGRQNREKIREFGISPVHRKTFLNLHLSSRTMLAE